MSYDSRITGEASFVNLFRLDADAPNGGVATDASWNCTVGGGAPAQQASITPSQTAGTDKAYRFNGDDYFSGSKDIATLFAHTASYSIEWTMERHSSGDSLYVMGFGGASGISMYWHSTGLLYIQRGSSSLQFSLPVADFDPHHYILTVNGATAANARLWKDNSEITPTGGSQDATSVSGTAIELGRMQGSFSGDFTLDNIAIFNTNLNSTKVGEHYSDWFSAASNTAPTVSVPTIETTPIFKNTATIQAKVASITDAEQATVDLTWELRRAGVTLETISELGVALPITNRTVNFQAANFGAITKGDSLTVRLTANDLQGTNNTTVQTSAATVVSNSAPVLGAMPSPALKENRQHITFDLSATDVDGGADITGFTLPNIGTEAPNFTVVSIVLNAPSGNTRTATVTLKPGIADSVPGSFNITARVTDGTANDDDTLTATVTNDASIVDAVGSQSVPRGTQRIVNLRATDPNAQDLNFKFTSENPPGTPVANPAWATIATTVQGPTETLGTLTIDAPAGVGTDNWRFKIKSRDGAL